MSLEFYSHFPILEFHRENVILISILMSVFRISQQFLFRLILEGLNWVSEKKPLQDPTIGVDLSPTDSVVFDYQGQKLTP